MRFFLTSATTALGDMGIALAQYEAMIPAYIIEQSINVPGENWAVSTAYEPLAVRANDFTSGLQQTLKGNYVGSDASNINITFAKFIDTNLQLQQILQTKGVIARTYPVLPSWILDFYLIDRVGDPDIATTMKTEHDTLDAAIEASIEAFLTNKVD
ncbi:hypothetical protein B0H63DRAFT_561521 [Podospora didyma]|uniref:Uncharacterized protein n=1 Tax=Podospora didyma TaxID=330526 RepID=A0AAE0NI57_9PEZI|nr:hypothetical protein B0H63DRAFT_561521 [Podospora didyma]